MPSGLIDTTMAKEAKACLKRNPVFWSILPVDPKNPPIYTEIQENWRKGMGDKLNYSVKELRSNLDKCLVPYRYDD